MTLEQEAERAAEAETRLTQLLQMIVSSAVDVLGFDAATVTAREAGGEPSTVVATDQRMVMLDDAQYQSGAGPCLDALGGVQVVVPDAARDERWPEFRQTADHLGVATTLSSPAELDGPGLVASINLYARRQVELDERALSRAQEFATQLAAAMESLAAYRAAAKLARDVAAAMRSRAVIEQAKGMLMAERGVNADQAFDLLRRMSQHQNVKLAELAARMVEQRTR